MPGTQAPGAGAQPAEAAPDRNTRLALTLLGVPVGHRLAPDLPPRPPEGAQGSMMMMMTTTTMMIIVIITRAAS